REELEIGSTVVYLTTLPRAELIANLSTFWGGIEMYTSSGTLSIQSAYDLFSIDAATEVAHKTMQNSGPPASHSRDEIVLICPAVIRDFLESTKRSSNLAKIREKSGVDRIIKFETSVSNRFPNCTVVCSLFEQLLKSLDFTSLLFLLQNH